MFLASVEETEVINVVGTVKIKNLQDMMAWI